MRLPPLKIVATILFFAIAILLLALISTSKPKPHPNMNVAPEDNNTVANYIDEVQRKNDLERDEKAQAEKLAAMAKAKKDSVECQFWKQQQTQKTTPKIEEKVSQFCEL
jgi:hypothetical protein